MLREYQEEIKRLKEQLEATQNGMVIDDSGKVRLRRYSPHKDSYRKVL